MTIAVMTITAKDSPALRPAAREAFGAPAGLSGYLAQRLARVRGKPGAQRLRAGPATRQEAAAGPAVFANLRSHRAGSAKLLERASILAATLGLPALLCTALGGCLATEYQFAAKDTAPALDLKLAAAQPPIDVTLHTVLIYDGPGSWKRASLWDEYIVSMRNQGKEPLRVSAVVLLDAAGALRIPGDDPWALEKQSQTLEQRYLREGVAFARSEIPDALVYGSGAVGSAAGTMFSAASATATTLGVVGLPLYYVVVFGVDHYNKAAVHREFDGRRLVLPVTLWPGETQTGSFFFPMTPDPKSLDLYWSDAPGAKELVLSLQALHGLHDAAPAKRTPAAPN
jgi:hypothetical protein